MRSRATNDIGERFPLANKDPEALLLDIGCGQGGMLLKMQNLGWKVFGIEPDPVAGQAARKLGVPVHIGTLETLQLPSNSVDHIIMSHVLEHLHSPREILTECYRILKRGGKLAIYTPNANSLAGKYFKRNYYALDTPRHLNIFSCKALRMIMKDTSFKDISVRTIPYSAHKLYSNNVTIEKIGKVDPFKFVPQNGQMFFSLLEHLLCAIGLPFGEELAVTAVKE
jgi:2-polyprenyl-3-methyl-5-hydroxy-6-metoxy-1,4-benzoquinol methylase